MRPPRLLRPQLMAAALMLAAASVVSAQPGGASAPAPREAVPVAADPALEARVQKLAAELRCLVCQNQSLADSNAELAQDLKNQVRDQLRAGRDERQVIDYMTDRYGDFVLYRPPFKATTLLLWAGPALLVLLAVGFWWRSLRSAQSGAADPAVAPADAARADALLGRGDPKR